MTFWKKRNDEAENEQIDRRITIDYLRFAKPEEYSKVIKIVEILRKADFDVLAVELGSEKAARQAQRDAEKTAEADNMLESLEEM